MRSLLVALILALASTALADPLVDMKSHGGLCADGPCGHLTTVNTDGSTSIGTQIPPKELKALVKAIDHANWKKIKSHKFKGTCPTAVDGSETIYTFHTKKGDVEIAECKVVVNYKAHPFVDLDKALDAAQPTNAPVPGAPPPASK